MTSKIRIAVDVRDLRLASTGTKTYLEELLKVFRQWDGDRLELIELNSFWKPYWGHSKWGKAYEHVQYFIWKQLTLPLKTIFSGADVLMCTDYYVPLIKFRAQHVVVFHDALFFDHPEYYNPIWLKLFKLIALPAARRAAVIIAPSEFSKSRLLLHEKGFEGKIKVVYQGPKSIPENEPLSEKTSAALKRLNGSPYILHVGVLEKRKNLANLIRALYEVRKTQDIKLVLVGRPNPKIFNNSEAEILSTIKELQLEHHVIFTGYVPDTDLPYIYKNAKAYVFPSVYEGFGIPILEAFRYGIPVAVANNSSLPEIGQSAVVTFDPHDVSAIATAIQHTTNNPQLATELVAASKPIENLYTWKNSCNQLLGIVAITKKSV